VQIRKCSPFLESSLLFGNNNDALASNEWKTVPDIWKSSAEKYGDKVALVDHIIILLQISHINSWSKQFWTLLKA
jgi:hypothetical protein